MYERMHLLYIRQRPDASHMRELSLPQTLFLIQSPATRNLFRHDTQLLMYTPYHSTIVPNPVLMKSPGSSIAN